MKFNSSQLIPLSFFAAIIIGTILLDLPIATASGTSAGLVTSLFTSTTSICVTGLVVVDSYAYWSLFGKIVILILIQLGGLGVISVTSILMLMISKRISLSSSVLLHDAFNLTSISGLKKFIFGVFKGTFLVEAIGAFFYMPVFIPKFGVAKGIWVSVFNSISSFCNAGIDILGPDSLVQYSTNPLVVINTMVLIILGGLGYVVWFDINNAVRDMLVNRHSGKSLSFRIRKLSEHTKLVLTLTFFLIVIGAVCVFIMEYDNPDTIGNMSMGDKILNSIFQSVTFRTAGFATVPQQNLTEPTCIIGSIMMFIGGSPVGTAGGVKTVTFFAIIANAVAFIRNRNETVLFGRKISRDLIQKSTAIVTVSFFITIISMILIMMTNQVGITDAMYETFSATATVGLSRALTPQLNVAGRLIIIVAMYLGRIGPISMALFFNYSGIERNNIKYIKGNFFVG